MHPAVMGADLTNNSESRLTIGWSRVQTFQVSAKFVRLAELRKLKETEQVAAVCYRVRGAAIEFLLVQTRKRRWIFPKGHVEKGETPAHARNSAGKSEGRSAGKDPGVNAHLCEVSRLVPPQESDRNPTWFSAEKAKRRLREDRAPDFGGELARVVDRAVARIRRARSEKSGVNPDPEKVQFIDIGRVREASSRSKLARLGDIS